MAIYPSEPKHFRIHQSAITFAFNDLGDANNVAISVYTNAKVSAYIEGIIPLTPSDEARQWTLTAFPTHFNDDVARYCHIALSREGGNATLVFPDTRLDIYGRAITDDGRQFLSEDGTPVPVPDASPSDPDQVQDGSAADPSTEGDYYFLFLGKITARGEAANGGRDWASTAYPICGILETIRYWQEESGLDFTQMFQFDDSRSLIRVLKPLLDAVFVAPISLIVGNIYKRITNIFRTSDTDESILPEGTDPDSYEAQMLLDEVLPTESHMRKYGNDNYLSKKHDDTAEGNITIEKTLTVKQDAAVLGDFTTEGTIGSADFRPDLFGRGWRITNEGHGDLESISIRTFAEFPELRFERISVYTGVKWQTFGSGLIEDVFPSPDGNPRRGIIKLKLEDGEYGSVAPEDKCMGIFHFFGDPVQDGSAADQDGSDDTSPSESSVPSIDHNFAPTDNVNIVVDEHNGNFAFAGFTTVYFRVVAICDENGDIAHPDPSNRYFIYELRPDWALNTLSQQINAQHPQPCMSFAAYANASNSSRQSCQYSTTTYTIRLAGMKDWIYSSANIQYILGNLNGFTIDIQVPTRDANGNIIYNQDGTAQTHTEHFPLQGDGLGVGNIYRWGNERTLERPKQLLTQQLYYFASSIAPEQLLPLITAPDGSAATTAVWQTDPISPTATTPYIYAHWLRTYIEGGVESQERSAPFLFATFGESPITYRWSTPVVPINVARSGWIIDDVPPTITQVSTVQHITATVCLVKGIDDYQPISSVTISDPPSFIIDFTAVPVADFGTSAPVPDGSAASTIPNSSLLTPNSWQVAFDVTGFDSDQTVTVPFTITTASGEAIPAPLLLAPSFAGSNGHDGSDGSNGNDAVIIDIEPSLNNFVVNEDEMVTPSITFGVYRVVGNKRREPLRDFLYGVNFLNNEGEQIAPAQGSSTTNHLITVDLATSSYATSFGMNLNTVSFSVLDQYGVILKSVNVTRVNAGESGPPGPPGNDGADAVLFEIEPTSEVIRTNTAGSATARWGCRLYRIIGTTRAEYNDAQWDITITKPSFASVNETASGSSFSLSATTIGAVASITVKAFDTSINPRRLVSTRTFYAVADGAPGLQGVVIRQRGLWNAYSEYVNQSESKRTDLRYIDIVQVKHDNIIDYYECKPTADGAVNIGHDPTAANWQTYWIKADYQEFIATQLLLARNAAIEFGQNNQLLIMDVNGEIVGGFTGFTLDENGDPKQNPIRLWVGAVEPADAPFHVKHDGTLVSANVNSDFQDITGLASEAYDSMAKQQSILLEDVRNGSPLYNSAGVRVPIKPRIYNIIANRSCIVLPTDIAYIGQRVLICNTEDVLSFDPTDGTQVVQHFPGDNDSSFDITFCGAGLWARHWYEQDINGITVDRGERYVSATSIAFLNGTMEFVGIPYVHKGVPCCRWSLITDGTCIKWFAYEYHVVGNNDKQYDWHSVMNYNN